MAGRKEGKERRRRRKTTERKSEAMDEQQERQGPVAKDEETPDEQQEAKWKKARDEQIEEQERQRTADEEPQAEPEEEEGPADESKKDTEPQETGDKAPCPVVGVGASAGGLEALQGLFGELPQDLEVAFIVVQHRASDRTSVMRSLLEKKTQYQVQDIHDGMGIRPKAIYLAPADQDVSIIDSTLYLSDPPPHMGAHLPIDAFLRSLAQDGREKTICIILSGTGSDGTLGLKEIKAAGGVAMVQEPEQAKYDDMPRNAIETDMVDFVLPVEKMGKQLSQYIRHPFVSRRKGPAKDMEKKFEGQLQRVFAMIRSEAGHDFSHYKRSTIRRRIARRLAVHQIQDLGQYVKLLQEKPEEVRTLAREMLITVTNFFRDPKAFEALKEHVIRPLVQEKPGDGQIRIWVAGCATGEEAYSIAMLVQEQMSEAGRHIPVQVFATDLDEHSLSMARHGLYPKSIAADVSQEQLRRFFIEENNHYKIRNVIREMVVFAKHNLVKDAPFSKLDLVSCRNVLIYMDNALQRKLIPILHHTLNPGGRLFLGESESIGTFSNLFAPVDSKHKIFRRKPFQTHIEPDHGIEFYPQSRGKQKEEKAKPKAHSDPTRIAERVILRDYSLPCVLVDDEYNAVYFNGDTSAYLNQPGGMPTFNVIHMARPEIHYKLNLLLKRVFHEKHPATERDVQVRVNDGYQDVDILARPINELGVADGLVLVVFQTRPKEKKAAENSAVSVDVPEQEKDARIRELEQELQSTKEYLQTTIEELETSNEELKSSNEELQSTNEELQSTNEELDTSREELQSTNEELRTVNSEHQQTIDELSRAYDDLSNLLGATEVATLFLDSSLKIRRFTPAARKLFRLIDRDVGRPLNDIASSLRIDDLLSDIHAVRDQFARVDKEVRSESGEWYQMKILPYRTAQNVSDGVVVTFVDVTGLKEAGTSAEQAAEFAEAIVETVRQPLLVLDNDLRVSTANAAFYRHFHADRAQTLGMLVYELGNGQWDIRELRTLLEQIVPENAKFEDYRVEHEFPKIGRRTMLLSARQVMYRGQATGRILLAFEDITDRQGNGDETQEK